MVKTDRRKDTAKAHRREAGTKRTRSFFERISLPPVSLLVIAIAVFACYAQTLAFDFTRLDDDLILTNNIDYYRDLSKIGTSFTRDAFNREKGFAFYRPIQNLSFFIDARMSGSSPVGFKITNLLIHLLTCFSLLFLFRRLRLDDRLTFLAVLIYSVHPLFNHAVIWIPARGDLLIAFFGIASYLSFITYLESNRVRDLAIHTAVFSLAAFSKETALLLPVIFAVHILVFERPITRWSRYLPAAVSWMAVTGIYLYSRAQVIVKPFKAGEVGIGPFVGNIQTIPEFLAKFVLPVNLSVMPAFSVALSLMGVAVLVLLAWWAARNFESGRRILLIGGTWFLVFTGVTMVYRHELGKAAYDYLEHRAYMPMIGVLLVLVVIVQNNLARWSIKAIGSCGMAVAAVLAVATVVHSRSYENPMTFYTAAIRSNPGSAMAYYNRAQYRRSLGDRDGAIRDYGEAVRVKPDLSDAYYNRANAKKEAGDLKGAIQDYSEAIRCNAAFTLAYYNRGTVRLGTGDRQGAITDLSQAVSLDPANVNALNNRGAAYFSLDQLGPALSDFNRVLELDPKYADAWRNRGSVKLNNGDATGACADWQMGGRAGSKESVKLFQEHCR